MQTVTLCFFDFLTKFPNKFVDFRKSCKISGDMGGLVSVCMFTQTHRQAWICSHSVYQ